MMVLFGLKAKDIAYFNNVFDSQSRHRFYCTMNENFSQDLYANLLLNLIVFMIFLYKLYYQVQGRD